jgi:hypothetical protein
MINIIHPSAPVSIPFIMFLKFFPIFISPLSSTVSLLTRAVLQSRYWHAPFYSHATDTRPYTVRYWHAPFYSPATDTRSYIVSLLTRALLQSRYWHTPLYNLVTDTRRSTIPLLIRSLLLSRCWYAPQNFLNSELYDLRYMRLREFSLRNVFLPNLGTWRNAVTAFWLFWSRYLDSR